jgi:hypothetical protein
MSDYGQMQEQLAIALSTPEAMGRRQPGQEQMHWLRMEPRNPPPKPEPALAMARTQAEWHKIQQALVLAETPPEELAMAMGVSEGVEASKQQGERMHEERARQAQERINVAKRDLEGWRSGKAPDLRVPRSPTSPASTPGYVPAPVQGQVPPVPGEVEVAPDHARAHQRIAEAHRQAAGIHQAEGEAQPANQPQHAQAAAAHEQQAQIHSMESQGMPNAPEAAPTAERQQRQDEERRRLEGQTQVTHPPTEGEQNPQDPAALRQAQQEQERQRQQEQERQKADEAARDKNRNNNKSK